MADIEILQKKENMLLKRTEIRFKLTHPKEKTPQRGAVRDKLAAQLGGKREGVIIAHMNSRYGSPDTFGYAKIYESADAAKKMEAKHLLKRHGLVEEKKAAEGEAKPAAAPAKAPEKKK